MMQATTATKKILFFLTIFRNFASSAELPLYIHALANMEAVMLGQHKDVAQNSRLSKTPENTTVD